MKHRSSCVTRARVAVASATLACCGSLSLTGCQNHSRELSMSQRVDNYATVRLTADLSGLSAGQQRMLPRLISAAEVIAMPCWRHSMMHRRVDLRKSTTARGIDSVTTPRSSTASGPNRPARRSIRRT